MADNSNILSDFGINLLEEDIDDVIFQTNEFLCDATFTGSQGPFWWILQMSMALAALFSIIVAAGMAYKMMVKHEPLDVMKLFKPLVISVILCWWYPPADTNMTNSGSSWCVLDFYPIYPTASAVTLMTYTVRRRHKSVTSLKKCSSSSMYETRCTPISKHRQTWRTKEPPTPT